MTDEKNVYLTALAKKLDNIFAVLERLKQENDRLTQALVAKHGYSDSDIPKRIMELEAEVRQLKKENKTLKEREKLIKNKTERLAVKLEEIDL